MSGLYYFHLALRLSILFCAGSLLACETVVNLDLPSHSPQLVVTGFFNPDSVWTINVSKSISANSQSALNTQFLDDATVLISQKGDFVDRLEHVGLGQYTSSREIKPIANKEYTLEVSVPNNYLPPISATASIPPKTTFFDVGISMISENEFNPRLKNLELSFSFEDLPGESYYLFSVSDLRSELPTFYYKPLDFITDDRSFFHNYDEVTVLPEGLPYSSFDNWAIVADYRFSESVLSTNVIFEVRQEEGESKNIRLMISTLSLEYFWYQEDLVEQESASEIFYEPNQVYSNIEGGLGIFAGYNNSLYELQWPECCS